LLAAGCALTLACGTEPPAPTKVVVTPPSVVLTALGQTLQLTAAVADQHGDPITAEVSWSSSDDAVASVSPTGLVTALAAGEAQIIASAGEATTRIDATVSQELATLQAKSGNAQVGVAGTALAQPLVVVAKDARGNPIAGLAVSFTVAQGGGQVQPAQATTGADGTASATLTLGGTPGAAQQVTVSAEGSDLTAVFTATATGEPASMAPVAGNGQSARAGVAVPAAPAVRVADAGNQPVPGVAVRFSVARGGGSVTGADQLTNSNGIATVGAWMVGPSGVNTLEATVDDAALAGEPAVFVATTTPAAGYDIDVRYLGTPSSSQLLAFAEAEVRWESIITGDVEDGPIDVGAGTCGTNSPALSETLDDVIIFATLRPIDGPLGILGQAGPCFVRTPGNLTAVGLMEFDVDDLDLLDGNGVLDDVILHEMGHVLGIGSLWPDDGLLADAGGADPHFTGAGAIEAFNDAGGTTYPDAKVPVENMGGPGTRLSHWRESVLGRELMTGFVELDGNPLSAITIRSLADQGYQVDVGQADPYDLASALRIAGGRPPLLLHDDVLHLPVRRLDARGRAIGATRR
jgi:hypothetical protein